MTAPAIPGPATSATPAPSGTPPAVAQAPASPTPAPTPVPAPKGLREFIESRQTALGTGAEPLIPVGGEPPAVVEPPDAELDALEGMVRTEGEAAPVVEGVEGEPPAEGTDGAEGEPPEGQPFVALLPGRDPNDPDVELEVPDRETFERLNQLRNGFARNEQLKADRQALVEEHGAFVDAVDQFIVDPIDTLERRYTPMQRAEMALHLLADPELMEIQVTLGEDGPRGVGEVLALLLDQGEGHRLVSRELRLHRSESKDQRRTELEDRRVTRKIGQETVRLIDALTPPNLDDGMRKAFLELAQSDLLKVAKASETGLVHPRDVPQILAPRLKAFGMTQEQVQAVLDRLYRRPTTATPPGTAPETPGPASPRRVVARPTIESLQAAAARRRDLTTAPPGGGAPALERQIPKNVGIRDAIKSLNASREKPL